jgi:hypothetical protein
MQQPGQFTAVGFTDKAKILKKNNKNEITTGNHVNMNDSTIHAAASSNSLP